MAEPKEIYIEMVRNGAYLKCTAIDPTSGEEATAIGPATDQEGVKRLAILKLRNRLESLKPSQPGTWV